MKQKLKEKQLPNHNNFVQIKPIDDENLPGLLKETRKKLGLSLEEMVIILDTSERTCRRWESGESEPGGQCIARIHKLRESYPEVFPVLKQPLANNQDEKTKLWLKELTTELNEQQEKLVKELTLTISRNNPETNRNTNSARNRSNDDSDIEELFNRLTRLEKRLAFLEEKCGYPYNPPQRQYQQQSQYNQQYDRNKRRR